MKKVVKLISLLVTCILLLGILASCQEPKEEIDYPSPAEAFTKADVLGNYIQGISLLDGSADNIIDNSSCIRVVFPVQLKVEGKTTSVESLDELAPIQDLYDLNPYKKDLVELMFPVNVRFSDYSEKQITSKEELDQIAASCTEWGNDNDIESVDFQYPVSIAGYDPANQLTHTQEIQDDQTLHSYLGGLSEEDLISLNFPVFINTSSETLEINDHTALLQLIDLEEEDFDEMDRRYYPLEKLPMGTVSLTLTDAPFPIDQIEEAIVTITRIDVKTGIENDSVPFITLFNDSASYDLLELTNGIVEELSETEIPAGSYQFFRLHVTDGTIILKDGKVFEMEVPSGSQSGIIVNPSSPIVISEGKNDSFLFDFDLGRSFIPRGNPSNPDMISGFNFRPVIRVSDFMNSGTLEGEVSNVLNEPLSDVQITLLAADTVTTTTFTQEDGEFKILGLDPGTYTVQAEKDTFQLFTSGEIMISGGESTSIDIELNIN